MSMFDLRDRMYRFVTERAPPFGVALTINPNSASYKTFTRYDLDLLEFLNSLFSFSFFSPFHNFAYLWHMKKERWMIVIEENHFKKSEFS